MKDFVYTASTFKLTGNRRLTSIVLVLALMMGTRLQCPRHKLTGCKAIVCNDNEISQITKDILSVQFISLNT